MLRGIWGFIRTEKNSNNGRQMALDLIRKTIIRITNYDKAKIMFFIGNAQCVHHHSSTIAVVEE